MQTIRLHERQFVACRNVLANAGRLITHSVNTITVYDYIIAYDYRNIYNYMKTKNVTFCLFFFYFFTLLCKSAKLHTCNYLIIGVVMLMLQKI